MTGDGFAGWSARLGGRRYYGLALPAHSFETPESARIRTVCYNGREVIIMAIAQEKMESGGDGIDLENMIYDDSVQPFWEKVVEMGMRIPDEELDKIPTDGSINYRNYLYGAPKRKA